jgi:hypothetical protein
VIKIKKSLYYFTQMKYTLDRYNSMYAKRIGCCFILTLQSLHAVVVRDKCGIRNEFMSSMYVTCDSSRITW